MEVVRKATVIFSKDIKKSKSFYEEVLNFSVDTDFTSVIFFKEGLAIWQIQESHLLSRMFGKDFFQKGKTFELYFEIKNWKLFIKNLKNHKIKYLHKAHEEPWGQNTIRFYDPDYNIIEVGETLEESVKRLEVRGKTREQIAEINGLPIEKINKILNNQILS